MRHRRLRRKLGVKSHHRQALLRNLVRNLVIHKRIQTTFAKAKEASSFADQMVTLAKRGDLHARRLLIQRLGHPDIADSLIKTIAPHFKERKGGYTRVLRLGIRKGDAGQMALLEFSTLIEMPEKPKKPKKEKKAKEITAPEKPKKVKELDEEPVQEKREKVKEAKTSDKKEDKKESEKKGGFLGALRKFLKGDEK